MVLSNAGAVGLAKELKVLRDGEKRRLDKIHDYLRDDPDHRRLGGVPAGAPDDVVRLARVSRVNLLKYIVTARAQTMYVDGYQLRDGSPAPQWDIWRRNQLGSRQIGIHRAGLAYGAGYITVLPGALTRPARSMPVVRGASPRELTVAYGDDDQWPVSALQKRRGDRWRLIDEHAVYELQQTGTGFSVVDHGLHGATEDGQPVCPVVRVRDTDDLDTPVQGLVEPHLSLQDQINITTFALMVAQHYGAFRQRYILGWLAKSESDLLKVGARRILTFEDHPDDMQVGEFAQTDTRSHLDNREATIRHLATVSQTPVHELAGTFINMSADALEAARASHTAAGDENRMMAGESWEQALNLAGTMSGIEPDPSATVIWRDTTVRSLAESARALGELADRLHVPGRALWSRIPRVAQHELEQWAAMADESDPVDELMAMVSRQSQGAL